MTSVYLQIFDSKVVNYPALKTQVGAQDVILIYDPALASGCPIHAGVFVDEYALSNAIYRFPRSRRICLLQESPTRGMSQHSESLEERFDLVLTFDDRLLVRDSPYEKFLYGTSWINRGRPDRYSDYRKQVLCTFVGNLLHTDDFGYAFRKQVATALMKDSRVECWGKGIRAFEVKDDVLPGSYFSVAMENTRQDMYFTEKLIDCLVTETAPIYWGAPSIGDIFDLRGMIQFDSLSQLRSEIDNLSLERYEGMLPYIRHNREVAFELLLTGHETLGQRLSRRVMDLPEIAEAPLGSLSRSKGIAGLRKLGDRINFGAMRAD